MAEAYTKVQGKTSAGYETLALLLARQVARMGGGGALCVYRHGKPLVDIWAGVRNSAGEPWLAETSSVSFSTTKGVLSTLFHYVLEQERLDYDLRVCHLWPQFRAQGKEHLRIRDLLCHESGLYQVRGLIDHAERMLDWEYMVDVLATATPKPLLKHAYHGLTYGWLLGELIHRLTGKLPGQVFDEALVKPLNLGACYIGVPRRNLSGVARFVENKGIQSDLIESISLGRESTHSCSESTHSCKRHASQIITPEIKSMGHWVGRKFASLVIDIDLVKDVLLPRGMSTFAFDSDAVLQAQIPAANGVFTARGLARLYAILALNGTANGLLPNGRRFISQGRLEAIRMQQNHGLDAVVPMPMGWRLGYHRVFNCKRSMPQGLAHFGYGGSGAWADPQTGLSVGYVVNTGQGTPFGDLRLMQINHELFRILERLPQ